MSANRHQKDNTKKTKQEKHIIFSEVEHIDSIEALLMTWLSELRGSNKKVLVNNQLFFKKLNEPLFLAQLNKTLTFPGRLTYLKDMYLNTLNLDPEKNKMTSMIGVLEMVLHAYKGRSYKNHDNYYTLPLIKLLLEKGVDPNVYSVKLPTLIWPPICKLCFDISKEKDDIQRKALLDILNLFFDPKITNYQIDIDLFDPIKCDQNKDLSTILPLITAIDKKDTELLTLLLEKQAKVNIFTYCAKDNYFGKIGKISALSLAISSTYMEGVQLLLDNGADPTTPSLLCLGGKTKVVSMTSLDLAVFVTINHIKSNQNIVILQKDNDIMLTLLRHIKTKPPEKIKTINVDNVFYYALIDNKLDMMNELLELKQNNLDTKINPSTDIFGSVKLPYRTFNIPNARYPWMIVLNVPNGIENDLKMIDFLLKNGADPNIGHSDDKNPCHPLANALVAAIYFYSQIEIFKALLNNNSNKMTSQSIETAIHFIDQFGFEDNISLLCMLLKQHALKKPCPVTNALVPEEQINKILFRSSSYNLNIILHHDNVQDLDAYVDDKKKFMKNDMIYNIEKKYPYLLIQALAAGSVHCAKALIGCYQYNLFTIKDKPYSCSPISLALLSNQRDILEIIFKQIKKDKKYGALMEHFNNVIEPAMVKHCRDHQEKSADDYTVTWNELKNKYFPLSSPTSNPTELVTTSISSLFVSPNQSVRSGRRVTLETHGLAAFIPPETKEPNDVEGLKQDENVVNLTWFDGELTLQNQHFSIKQIEGASIERYYMTLPDVLQKIQKDNQALYDVVTNRRLTMGNTHIKQLDSFGNVQTTVRVNGNKKYTLFVAREFKIPNSPARIFICTVNADNGRSPLDIGILFDSKGLHKNNEVEKIKMALKKNTFDIDTTQLALIPESSNEQQETPPPTMGQRSKK